MNFLFDQNLPPAWAKTFSAASNGAGLFLPGYLGQVQHLQNRFARNADDIEWLTALGKEGGWAVVSGDSFRKGRGAEREVIRAYGITVFVLQRSWASRQYWDKLSQLVLWWPRIVVQANTVDNAALEVPWRHTSKFKQL